MDSRRWQEIEAAFDELAALEAAERQSRLAVIGTTDPALRAAIESLLAADAEADEWLASIDAALLSPAGAQPVQRLKDALAARYRIEREVRRGGMATVYLAQDLKHDRKVALKVLRPVLAAVLGAERFVQEIKTTASLHHPHILPLFDSGEADSFLYYVMPYIEGETLRDKLNRETQLGIDEAVRITTEVADALHYAHEQGVIHRDIKPENILLHNGRPLVTDFGIALAVRAAAGERMTEPGLSLGTPHYMSPEQATADKAITNRSDIYSLGAVLYEILTGDPPHTGSTAQQIISRIVTDEAAPVTSKRKSAPPNVAAAIAKALEKLPADRFKSAARFAEALADPGFALPSPAAAGRTGDDGTAVAGARYRLRWGVGLAALLVGLAAGYLVAPRSSALPKGYDIGLPDSAPLAFAMESPWGGGWASFVVSSREDFLVYVADRGGTTELWYRSLVGFDARPIPGTDGAYQPLLSPDDEWVAFVSGNQLKSSRLDRPGVTVVTELERFYGADWALVDTVAIIDGGLNRGLSLIDMHSGARVRVPLGGRCLQPHVLSDSRTVLCSNGDENIAFVSDLQGRVHRRLDLSAAGAADGRSPLVATDLRVVDDRYMLFVSGDGRLNAAAIDQQYNVIGRPTSVEPAPRIEGAFGVAQFKVTESGNLLFVPGEDTRVGRFVKADGVNPAKALPIRPARVQQFDVSPDGTRMVVVEQGVGRRELLFYDLETGRERRWLTAWDIQEPRWTQDGERVVFSFRENAGDSAVILIGSHTEPGPPDTLLQPALMPSQVTADGLLVGQIELRDTGPDIAIVDLTAEPLRADTIRLVGRQGRAAISPDGRWLAYLSTESGGDVVFLEPYPGRERRYRVAAGLDPVWLDRTTFVYRTGNSWYKVRIGGSDVYPHSEPEFWFRDALFVDTFMRSQAAHPDGSIIYVQGTGRSTASFVRVIPNWMEQIRQAVADANR